MVELIDDNQEICAEFVVEFVVESCEMIGDVEPELIELETEAAISGEINMSRIDSIFPAFHSMREGGGFLDLDNLVTMNFLG